MGASADSKTGMEAEAYNPSVSPGRGGVTVKVPAPISSSYVVKDPTDIIVDRKILSGGKYTIYESGGAVLFGVKGINKFFRTKRILNDTSGNALVSMKQECASLYSKWSVYRGEDDSNANLLYTMKKSSVFQFSPSMEVHLTGEENSKTPNFEVKGNFSRHKFKIFYGDKVVAEATKKVNAASIFLCKGQYAITIYPGVDQAFIASIVVILDEIARCAAHAASAGGATA